MRLVYPTKKQTQTLEWVLDRCRELYNAALQERRDAWKMCQVSVNFAMQSAQLPEIKKIRSEYKEIYAQVLQDVLHRVDKTFKAFFARVKRGDKPGFPRYKSRPAFDSFTYPQIGEKCTLHLEGGKVHLPKIGHVKIKLHRPVEGTIKTCTVKREGEHWYICLSCEIETVLKLPHIDEVLGIDLGLHHFAALSSGDLIDNPRCYRHAEKKLARIQQELARKKRGSKQRKKTIQKLSKTYRKVRSQRQDYLHQWSRRLVDTFEIIVFEDLAPSNMSRRPKPKQDETTGAYLPNGASQKSGLNKSILDAGWSQFITYCEYKAANAGTVLVVKVNPYKTSQVCSACGKEGPHKDLSERVHKCIHCGIVLDRDVNAAINIKQRWLGRSLQAKA